MSSIRLSICISTYKRAAFIGETLESIIGQLTDEVELIVLDDGSTDNTPEVLKPFEARCPYLRYLRVSLGESGEQKYCRAVTLARGEYCWLFADDDLLRHGAVAAVLEAAKQHYSLIIVNAEVRSVDFTVCLQPRRVEVDRDRIYSNASSDQNQLLVDTGVYLSFLGGVVIKRELWLQREKEKYFGTGLVHTGVVFQCPIPGNTLLLAHPWIVIRYGNASWLAQSFEIGMVKWHQVIWSSSGFADWAKEKVAPTDPWRSYPQLVFARAQGGFCMQDYQRWLASRIKSPLRRCLTRAIAGAPVRLMNFFARYYARWILRKNPSIGLYALEAWHQEHLRRRAAGQA